MSLPKPCVVLQALRLAAKTTSAVIINVIFFMGTPIFSLWMLDIVKFFLRAATVRDSCGFSVILVFAVAEGADLAAVTFVRTAWGVSHHVTRSLVLCVEFGAAGDAVGGFFVKGLGDGRARTFVLAAADNNVVYLLAMFVDVQQVAAFDAPRRSGATTANQDLAVFNGGFGQRPGFVESCCP